MFNGRGGGQQEAPMFTWSPSVVNDALLMFNVGRNNDQSSMFSRSTSLNDSGLMYNNRNTTNESMFSGSVSGNRNGSTSNDNSVFNSMDDLHISSWNGGGNFNSNGTTNNYNNSREFNGSVSNNRNNDVAPTENRVNGEPGANQGVRETGIIEKLLHSYGFIQCCERQARLFFHFSQFEGTIEHLKLGDPVEFEMTYDRRTGKPIASYVTKIGPEVVLSEERVNGTVTTELHHESSGELQGRISYENRGECFFLPYCQEDIEGNVSLCTGDSVSFQVATNQRSGNLTARYVRLENPSQPVRYRGIVSNIMDNFGFIERADVAKEIFFHFSETRVHEGIVIGDNIEFNIQNRNGKEVASSITKLPFGTVIFEDICTDVLKGQVLKPADKTQPTPLSATPIPRCELMQGRLRYRGPDRQELEVMYGEKDQQGSFTMRHGDWVEFQVAVDRRDKQQRATNVRLLEESFSVSGERREEGIVTNINLKDGSGIITCAERDQKVSFIFNELLDFTRTPKISDEIEFTIMPDPQSPCRQSGTRIKYLPPGTVKFEIPLSKDVPGIVLQEPSTPWVSNTALAGIIPLLANLGLTASVTETLIQNLSTTNELMKQKAKANIELGEPGIISYQLNGLHGWQTENISFHWKDCKSLNNVRTGSRILFDIHQLRRTREIMAVNIRSVSAGPYVEPEQCVEPSINRVSPNGEVEQFMVKVPEGSNNLDYHSNFAPINENHRNVTPPSDYQSSSENNAPPSSSGSSGSANGSSNSLVDEYEIPHTPSRYSPDSDDKSDTPSSCGTYGSKYSRTNSVGEMNGSSHKSQRFVMRGYIAALKDGFGFIETAAQDGEIFFHTSSLVGDFGSLDVGQEVEYVMSNKGGLNGKNAADMVKPLPRGTISRPDVFPEIIQGTVVRPVRGANPDQTEYMGLIEDAEGRGYSFGITSMLNKKEVLQAGEVVEFQVDAENNAVNIRALRKKLRATVEAVKGLYGFLSYELDDGKKLFFHMSEVKDHIHLNPGDVVEFVILQNPRNGKSSACSVVKLSETQRPERLLNRLSKLSVDESAPRLIVIRQPYGPDGTRGFTLPRSTRIP